MGHICTLLVEMVERELGPEGTRRVFELSGIQEQQFRPEEVYAEELFQALYEATKTVFEVDDETAQDAFAAFFAEVSPQRFPAIFKKGGNARGMLEMVPTIHMKWPSAAAAKDFEEKLWIEESSAIEPDRPDRIVFKYDSPNHLCGVLCGVARRVLEYYGERGSVSELCCAKEGAEFCRVEVVFESGS